MRRVHKRLKGAGSGPVSSSPGFWQFWHGSLLENRVLVSLRRGSKGRSFPTLSVSSHCACHFEHRAEVT